MKRGNKVSIEWTETYQIVDLLTDEIRHNCFKGGMTFKEVSRLTGLSTGCIRRIGYGETREPRPTTCLRLLRCFGYRIRVSG